jgi:formate-dependent nitrite reductase membrane component NrfD
MEESSSSTWWIDAGIYLSYFLMAIAMGAAVILPLIKSFGDPKGLVKSLIGIGALVLIFGFCYLLSSSDVPARFSDSLKQNLFTTPSSYQLVGGSIVMCYALLIITALIVVYSEVTKLFK